MRKKIIAGNWKMNKTVGEALALIEDLKPLVGKVESADIIVCPPYTALYAVSQAIKGTNIKLGAQGAFWKASGAYTSYISLPMLLDLGVEYVIIGHSETRGRFGVPEPDMTPDLMKTFGETDAGVNLKTKTTLAAGLVPIVCIGETLQERQAGDTDKVVQHQIAEALQGVSAEHVAGNLVFAYEPVWAIGTGEVCAADEADRVCGVVREAVRLAYDGTVADAVRIQYGGSMKPDNAADLLARPNIDGGLIGGASLKAADFSGIVSAAS
jgi:triosephosphate isomerase (TIM)